MHASDDISDLLTRFARQRCEASFRTLVERHTATVHAAARRMLHGNEAQAREVTQTVFVELARRAATLPAGVVLGAWLHRVACVQAALLIRTEVRRRNREATAAAMTESSRDDDAAWTAISPVLDDELNRLPAPDREALVLRYFENRGLRDVGAALGTTEDGARKRVSRALEKLRTRFVRQGLTAPGTAALAVLISERSAPAADPSVISAAAQAGLATPASLTTSAAAGGVAGAAWKTAAVLGIAALSFAGGRANHTPPKPPPQTVIHKPSPPPPAPPPTPVVAAQPPPPAPPPSVLLARLTADDAMLARIAKASAVELAELYDNYHGDLSPPLFDLLCQRWASLDVSGALDFLRRKHDSSFHSFYAAWARADFSAALAKAKTETGHWKADCIQKVIGSLLPHDVKKFLTVAAAAEKSSHVSASSVELAMRTLAAGGMDKALAAFATFKAPHLRIPAAKLLASLKAAKNPDEAIAWAKTLTDGAERSAALNSAILAFVDQDPDRVIALMPELSSDGKATDASFLVAKALTKRDAAAGLAWAAEHLSARQLEISARLIGEASGLSTVERLQAIRRFRERMEKENVPSIFLRSFDRTIGPYGLPREVADPAAEIQAITAAPPDPVRNLLIGELATRLQRTDFQRFLTLLPSLPADLQSGLAAKAAIYHQGPPSNLLPLLPFIKDRQDTADVSPRGNDYTLSSVLRDLGRRISGLAPEERNTLLAQVPADQRSTVLTGVGFSLALRDPDSAFTWAAALPPAEQPGAAEGIASHLARENEMTASEWINEMPRGPVRDTATRGLCEPLAHSEPDSAWQWALSISDPAIRTQTLGAVYKQWAKKGQAAAAAALSAAPLTSADRKAIQQFKP